jgi:hypothetical protein
MRWGLQGGERSDLKCLVSNDCGIDNEARLRHYPDSKPYSWFHNNSDAYAGCDGNSGADGDSGRWGRRDADYGAADGQRGSRDVAGRGH